MSNLQSGWPGALRIEMCVDSVENQVLGIAKHIYKRHLARSMLPFSLSLVPQATNALLHHQS